MSLGEWRAIQGDLSGESAAFHEQHRVRGSVWRIANTEITPAQLSDVDLSRVKPSSIQCSTHLYRWHISKD